MNPSKDWKTLLDGCDFDMVANEISTFVIDEKTGALTGQVALDFLAARDDFLKSPSTDTAIPLLEVAPSFYSYFEKHKLGGDIHEKRGLSSEEPDQFPDEELRRQLVSNLFVNRRASSSWKRILPLGLILVFVGWWYWTDSRSSVVLLPHGKAAFYRGGFFHRDRFNLVVQQGRWHFSDWDNYTGGDLVVPFECPYNKYRTLRLEDGGKVYTLDKENMTREELRVVDGEWSYDASDHWQSIFDLPE